MNVMVVYLLDNGVLNIYILRLVLSIEIMYWKSVNDFYERGPNLSKRELSFITRLYLVLPVPVRLFACFFVCH